MPKFSPQLSIIFPVHNEADIIEDIAAKLIKALKKDHISHEILFIENGSSDNSYKILRRLEKSYHNVYVFQSNLGWGNAVQKGIAHVTGKFTCYSVSDGQVDPLFIIRLYRLILHNPKAMAKIYRLNRENFIRKFTSMIFNLIVHVLFGKLVRDINATPKIMETSLLKSISLRSPNVGLDLELLLGLKARKIKCIEIPALSSGRKTGISTTTMVTGFEMLQDILHFRRRKF